jgi:organic radical activating enzyme
VPSVFFRTYGCNFRCRKFGLPRDQEVAGHNPEVVEIIHQIEQDPDRYKSFGDLPLVSTGCDSYASIYPEFKRFNHQEDVATIASRIHDLIPNRQWQQDAGSDIHLVITGGEPLLGYQQLYPELLELCRGHGLRNLTFETNGTQPIHDQVHAYLFDRVTRMGRDRDLLTFSVSPKLPCSGEAWETAIRPDIVLGYQELGMTYLKFVVATKQDVADAAMAVELYRSAGFSGPVYLMPTGGVPQIYNLNTEQVAALALERGWRYSPRLQVDIWRNAWGT